MKICTGSESYEELQKRFNTYSLQDRKRAVAYCEGKDSPKCSNCSARSNPHHVCMWMILFKQRPTDWIVDGDKIRLRPEEENAT